MVKEFDKAVKLKGVKDGGKQKFKLSKKSNVLWRKDKTAGKTSLVSSLSSEHSYYKPNGLTVYVQ